MIDRATADDAAAIAQVLGTWVRQTPWMPKLHLPVEDVWFCGTLIDTCDVWVLRQPAVTGPKVTDLAVTGPKVTDHAVTGPKVTGHAVTGFLARHHDDVRALYLTQASRGQGHGKALLDMAKTGRDRLELWTFQANSRAIAFYHREGFVEKARTDGSRNDENLPDLRLVWTGGLA